MKSGFIAILGKPNVGKSSLVNAIVGQKVSIVSPKAQTTRDRQMGILTTDKYQMVLVDTPGIHEAKNALGQYMKKAVSSASSDMDAIVLIFDATNQLRENEKNLLEKYLKGDAPVYVVFNKVDLTGFERVYPLLEKLSEFMIAKEDRQAIKEVIPLSSKTGKNVDKLVKLLERELKKGDLYYPEDEVTDKSVRYMICEIVREKALLFLQDEIPHGVGVFIQSMEDKEKLAHIEADIVCERDTHKQIIIGENGQMLKQIGERARVDIEKLLDKKVYLKLFVKVRKDWRNRKNIMDDIGYNAKKNF